MTTTHPTATIAAGPPSLEAVIAHMLNHPERSSSAEVVFCNDAGPHRYRLRVWRDGTIAMRPVKP